MNWALAVKGWACRVLGGQWVGLQGLRGSGGGPTGLQGVNGYAKRVPKGQGVGPQGPRGSRGRLRGSKGVRGKAYRGQGVGPQGPRGSTVIRFFLRTYGLTD